MYIKEEDFGYFEGLYKGLDETRRKMDDTGSRVTLLTTDCNMRNVARSYGIKAENFPFYLGDGYNRPKGRYLEGIPAKEYAPRTGRTRHPNLLCRLRSPRGIAALWLLMLIFYLLLSAR